MLRSQNISRFCLCTLYLVLCTFLFFSCKKENRWDLLKRTGDVITQTRTLDPFTDIYVGNNKIDIYIEQDSVFDVQVEAGEHLIDNVTTEVRDGRLYIENHNKCNFARSYKIPIKIFIHMPVLFHINHDGSGTIRSNNTLTGDSLDIITKSSGNVILNVAYNHVLTHLHSSADITLKGNCTDHLCFATGNGFFYGSELTSGYTWVFARTTGEIYVNVSDLFIVSIASIGDVYYTGAPPDLTLHQVGTGKLIAF